MIEEIRELNDLYKKFVAGETKDREALLSLIARFHEEGYTFCVYLKEIGCDLNHQERVLDEWMITVGTERILNEMDGQHYEAEFLLNIETVLICDMLIIVADRCAPRSRYFELWDERVILFIPQESDEKPPLLRDLSHEQRKGKRK